MIAPGAIQFFCDDLADVHHPERIVLFDSYTQG